VPAQPESNSQQPYPSLTIDTTHDGPSSQAPYFNLPSPLSDPSTSPSIMTPPEDFSQPLVSIAGGPHETHTFDLSSIFMPYPAFMSCEDGTYSKENIRSDLPFHCGCINEQINYSVLFELSLGLQKAADILACTTNHHLGMRCTLQQRIMELSTLATYAVLVSSFLWMLTLGDRTTLESTATLPDNIPSPLSLDGRRLHGLTTNILQPSETFRNASQATLPVSTISPQSLQGVQSWELLPTVSDSPDDSFMSWEPHRRL